MKVHNHIFHAHSNTSTGNHFLIAKKPRERRPKLYTCCSSVNAYPNYIGHHKQCKQIRLILGRIAYQRNTEKLVSEGKRPSFIAQK